MKRNAGFTLIETIVFIIVVSVALAGLATLFSTNISNSAAPLIRERTINLAQAYMDEILPKKWNENTPLGGACIISDLAQTDDKCTNFCASITDSAQCNRSKCNYNTGTSTCDPFNNTPVPLPLGPDSGESGNRSIWNDVDDYNGYSVSPPKDIDGNDISNFDGFTVSVNVTTPATPWNGIPARDVRRISVSVTNPLGETVTLISYRVNF